MSEGRKTQIIFLEWEDHKLEILVQVHESSRHTDFMYMLHVHTCGHMKTYENCVHVKYS